QVVPLLGHRAAWRVDLGKGPRGPGAPRDEPDVLWRPGPQAVSPRGAPSCVAEVVVRPLGHRVVPADPALAGSRPVPGELDVVGTGELDQSAVALAADPLV